MPTRPASTRRSGKFYRSCVAQPATTGRPTPFAHRIVHGGERFVRPPDRRHVLADRAAESPGAAAQSAGARGRAPRARRRIRRRRTWQSSTPRFTRRCRRPRASTRCREELSRRFGIRRFGFHGISHAHVWSSVAAASARHAQTDCGSSPVIWATAPASPRSSMAAASTPAWA